MTLKELLEELFFDYHIRGCKLADKKTNAMCNENKSEDIELILAKISKMLPAEMKFTDSERGCGCGECNQIETWNECLSEVKRRLGI